MDSIITGLDFIISSLSALIILIFFSFVLYENKAFNKTARKAKGNIFAVEKFTHKNWLGKQVSYRLIIDYIVDGNKFRFAVKPGNDTFYYNIGQKIDVMFLPKNPCNVRIDRSSFFVFGILICIFFLFLQLSFYAGPYGLAKLTELYQLRQESVLPIASLVIIIVSLSLFFILNFIPYFNKLRHRIIKNIMGYEGAVTIGTVGDPLFNCDSVFYMNRRDYIGKIRVSKFLDYVSLFIFISIYLVLVWLAWGEYSRNIKDFDLYYLLVLVFSSLYFLFIIISGVVRCRNIGISKV